jgi:hypothetical protein
MNDVGLYDHIGCPAGQNTILVSFTAQKSTRFASHPNLHPLSLSLFIKPLLSLPIKSRPLTRLAHDPNSFSAFFLFPLVTLSLSPPISLSFRSSRLSLSRSPFPSSLSWPPSPWTRDHPTSVLLP